MTQTWQSMKGVVFALSYPIFKVPNSNMRSKTREKGHSVNVYIYTWLLSTYCLDNLGGKQQASNHLVIMWTWPWIMWFLRWESLWKNCVAWYQEITFSLPIALGQFWNVLLEKRKTIYMPSNLQWKLVDHKHCICKD